MEEVGVSDVEACRFAFAGDLEKLQQLIAADGSAATNTDKVMRTPLHWAASAGHDAIVMFLLQNGCDPNLPDDEGWSALHIASSAGRTDIVRALIAHHANINATTKRAQTPMLYAASRNRQERGADANLADCLGATPLHRAASCGHLKVLRILVEHGANVQKADAQGNSPLHLACEEERTAEAQLLVRHCADLSLRNHEGQTPLDVAPMGLATQLQRMTVN
uniref:26S proteasome non-ATPase regulatory subunit 10-like isoform X2 n=1 Tax=Myxine glutinosa TaxID=7769 RepID=UPI003590217E